jgi:hypothetical protein
VPMRNEVQAYVNALLRVASQPSMLTDVRALATAAGAFLTDLDDVAIPTVNAWGTTMLQDNSTASTAANVLRSDLGLPPPPT